METSRSPKHIVRAVIVGYIYIPNLSERVIQLQQPIMYNNFCQLHPRKNFFLCLLIYTQSMEQSIG